MKITLSPSRGNGTLTLNRVGDVLTINGESYDFSGVLEGNTLPNDAVECAQLLSDVYRESGVLYLTLILPYDLSTEYPIDSIVEYTVNEGDFVIPNYTPEG